MKRVKILLLCLLFISQSLTIHALSIEGEAIVEIAQQGESYSYYHIEDKGYTFQLVNIFTGVNLLEDGTLIVDNKAKEGMITIAANKGADTLYKRIELVSSWTTKNDNAKKYAIPSIKEARSILIVDTDGVENVLRWVLIVSTIIFLSGYACLRYRGGKL